MRKIGTVSPGLVGWPAFTALKSACRIAPAVRATGTVTEFELALTKWMAAGFGAKERDGLARRNRAARRCETRGTSDALRVEKHSGAAR